MKTKLIQLAQLFLFCIFSGMVYGQPNITYSGTLNPTQLVQNILLGAGVSASNITYNGSAVTANAIQMSARSYTATNFPFSAGIYLRTQGGTTTNVSNDPDLISIANGNPTNGAVLEFDFVATGDSLNFKYIFASAEYTSFTCSGFNDAFGFFLSGPGIVGTQNLAVVPGTNIPVTINTVNSGVPSGGNPGPCAAMDPNWQSNSIYFTLANNPYSGEGYNGGTTGLVAAGNLICGETYHIKLAVCNVLDQALNSGVYLEAGSFTTFPVDFTFNTYTLDNVIYEGCDQLGTIMFTRAGCSDINDTLVAYLQYGGCAINGVDYTINEVNNPGGTGDSVFFAPGVDTIYWQILPVDDLIAELCPGFAAGLENIIISISTVLDNGDTITDEGVFFISDPPAIVVDAMDQTYLCRQNSSPLTSTVTGGFAPYTYQWSNGAQTQNTSVPISGNGVTGYSLTVTDACGYVQSDSAYITMNQTISIDTILMGPATCEPVGWVSAIVSGQTNPINITFDWTNANDTNIVFPDQSALPNLGGGWYVLTLTDNNIPCSVTDSVFVETINTPQAIASVSPNSGCSPVTSVFSNNSQNATTYTWNFGNGNVVTTGDMSNISQIYYSDATITLTASNGNPACDDVTTLFVDVVICGCMDPEALNYNPLAVLPGEECIYPVPTVVAPNVITANGDAINGYFFLETTNAETIELTILNRWGNVLYTGSGNQLVPPYWNGADKSGVLVEDGVYFYRYRVTGKLGDELEGHGFVTVVR